MLEELGIKLVRLDLPFRLNHVNCFIAEGENGWTIIDAGIHDKKTAKVWRNEIIGKNISSILISHFHPDHLGYAGALQKITGAPVSMSEIDASLGKTVWTDESLSLLKEKYILADIPYTIVNNMLDNYKEYIPQITPLPTVNYYLKEGDKILLGKYEYEIIYTPGHSEGLVTLYNSEKNVLISTDHILPKITPNISYWFRKYTNPLADYLLSLEKIKKRNADYVIPSHGKPFYGANVRIGEIIQHHNQRLEQTLKAIKHGGSVYETCLKLFQDKDLDIHALRSATGETFSHLEYLWDLGECKREYRNGFWWYYL